MVSNIKQSPLVSITCLTYNHAPYLRQCLDGFVMQKTSFPIEILIYDDASEDGTQDIIREYERKYPDLIKPIYQTENQYSKGVKVEFVYNYPRAKGKYIAFCEGDDYWTDPNKLQKQIDFLERHQEHVMCSHQYKLYFQKEKIMDHAIRPIGNFSDGISFDLSFLIRGGWLFQPLSVVFRKSALDLNMYSKYAIHIDVVLLYAILKNGKEYCMSDVMGIYRIHDAGVWSRLNLNHQRVFSLKARMAIYDVEKTDEAALFILSQFSRPMGRLQVVREYSMFLRITKILITHFGSNFVLRMWFTILAFNKKLSVNEFYQIEDFCKRNKDR